MKVLKKVFTGSIKGIDEKERTLTALVSTGATDRMDEVLDPKGVILGAYRKNPVVLWAHDYSTPPIGKALWVKKTAQGILSKVQFAKTAFAEEIFSLYKEGFLSAFSVGFIPKEHTRGDTEKGEPWQTFTKWEMIEYSAVPVPANPEALTLALQKGLVKTLSIREGMLKGVEDDEEIEEIKEIEEDDDESGLEELIEENKTQSFRIRELEKENGELKYEQYRQSCLIEKSVSEITVVNLEAKAIEIIDGVIRKHQGKID